jgi:hypothetical protein
MVGSTKWIITFKDLVDDEVDAGPGNVATTTIHLALPDKEAAAEFVAGVYDEFGAIDGVSAVEVPSTWECDGRDNCMVMA